MGAYVGDIITSVLFTCMKNNENPYEYSIALLENSKEVAESTENWLPWNWRVMLEQKNKLLKKVS